MKLSEILKSLFNVKKNNPKIPEKYQNSLINEHADIYFLYRGKDIAFWMSRDISDIVHVSKETSPNAIFVCIKGKKYDGNEFINEAYERGTRIFVTEDKNVEIPSGMVIIVKNARKILAELCRIVFDFPDKKLCIVGVTGTKGKTTVSYLSYKLLSSLRNRCAFLGTVGVMGIDTAGIDITVNTTQDARSVFKLLKRAYDDGIKIVILEVSSQAIKEERIFGVEFDILVFTSFSKDHIGVGEHSDLKEYISEKRKLFTSYGADVCIVNYDDAYSSYFSSGIKRVIRCGFTSHSDYLLSSLDNNFDRMHFIISGESATSRMPGKYNAENAALAIALSEEISGFGKSQILNVLKNITVPGRFEHFSVLGRDVIIDYAHNRESFYELIKLARELTSGKIISVFGSVGERSFDRRRELAEAAEELSDFSVITSDNPNFEDPYRITLDIYSSFKNKENAKIITDREEAIKYAISVSEPGDSILLLGKGHEEYILFRGEKQYFSEREILRSISEKIDFKDF